MSTDAKTWSPGRSSNEHSHPEITSPNVPLLLNRHKCVLIAELLNFDLIVWLLYFLCFGHIC